MKREFDSVTMANCLMLLSKGGNFSSSLAQNNNDLQNQTRVFKCKTCNKNFSSFQALGGHRASHKKPKLMGSGGENGLIEKEFLSPSKPKMHECSICGLTFAVGQALGGHMRRHRGSSGLSRENPPSLNNRRVLCIDLNLTPIENELQLFKLQKVVQI